MNERQFSIENALWKAKIYTTDYADLFSSNLL